MKFNRLLFGFLLLAGLARAEGTDQGPVKLGLQSWTCSRMSFEQVADFAVKHGIRYLELFAPAHLDPAAPRAENLRKKAYLEERGLVAYSFGVNKAGLDKGANRKLFELAKLMGMKVIAIEPKDPAAWDNLEELVKEYDIKLAIHNHDLDTVYGDPATVRKILATRDHRIGVCLDLGWVTAAGFDAAEVFRGYGDRVYDLHFKDKHIEKSADGKKISIDTAVGEGAVNYPAVFAALAETHWTGVMAIEAGGLGFTMSPDEVVGKAKTFFLSQTTRDQHHSSIKP